MAKKNNDSSKDLLKHLKGFCSQGADFKSPGNIPTGHFSLDFAIQYGMDPTRVDLNSLQGYDPNSNLGLPLGKLVEIYGEEGGGKSSLAYRVAGYAQKMGHLVAWIDTEHSFSPNLASINGCDKDLLLYSNLVNEENPDKDFYGEDVINNICKMCEHGVGVVVLDSVANLVPKALMEASAEQQFMGLLARMLSENVKKLVSYAAKYGTLLVFINQLRENLRVTWGDPETSPGGHSLKHNASVRLKVSKKNSKDANIMIQDEDTGDEKLIGRHANIRIIKNRVAKPYFTSIQVPIYYESYFPEIEEIAFDTGRQVKLITVMKGIFKWNDIRIEGKRNFISHILENNLIDDLINDVKEKSLEKNVILPPELMQYKGSKNGVAKKISRGRPKKDSTDSEK